MSSDTNSSIGDLDDRSANGKRISLVFGRDPHPGHERDTVMSEVYQIIDKVPSWSDGLSLVLGDTQKISAKQKANGSTMLCF